MRLTRLPVIATATTAALSAAFVAVGTWDENKAGLLVALSVIAAATLVRLARGLPFTNPDHFEPDEVEQVTGAVKRLARSLRALLGVTLGTMVLLVVAQPLANALALLTLAPPLEANLLRAVSAIIGASFGYAMVRIWQIVGSDISLLDKQATFMVRAVRRKQRKADEDREKASDVPPFETPEGYGKRLQ